MLIQQKQILFKSFLYEWEYKFRIIPSIMRYLATYPELIHKLKTFQPIDAKNIACSQLEWVSLISQFDHPLEKEFFKPFWVPINQNEYDYFIDISSETFSLFEIQYLSYEPYRWRKKYLVEDIRDYLLLADDPCFMAANLHSEEEKDQIAKINLFFLEQDLSGFDGEIEPSDIKAKDVVTDLIESNYIVTENMVVFKEVFPLVAGIIPENTEIKIDQFVSGYNRFKNFKTRIKNINGLIFLLQTTGKYCVDYYTFSFGPEKEGFAEFINNTFTVRHNDQSFIKGMIEKFEFCKNS